ncbi:MAG: hypothetical protein Q8O34_18030, partial [Rhodocyclaceae bacterium]|nr:hypothetical protein [Rhodocyclaceae bacterium]
GSVLAHHLQIDRGHRLHLTLTGKEVLADGLEENESYAGAKGFRGGSAQRSNERIGGVPIVRCEPGVRPQVA